MQPTQHRIYPLDKVSQSRIQSSIHVSSLNEVILELVKNALDANAKSINVLLNYTTGFCCVRDDGHGIAAQEFAPDGRLGDIYCMYHMGFLDASTDSLGTSNVSETPALYGRHGRHIAAISGVALLSISSRHEDERVHTLWLSDTGRLGHYVEQDKDWHALCGTRVRVYNLFSKFPVRRKHLASRFTSKAEAEKELNNLKHHLTALTFAFPDTFNIDVRLTDHSSNFGHKRRHQDGDSTGCRHAYRDTEAASSVLYQLGYTDQPHLAGWQSVSVSSQDIDLQAAISSVPSPHRLIQFISVNHSPLSKEIHPALFEVVNSTFEASTFGPLGTDETSVNESTVDNRVKSLHSGHISAYRKGIDKWPMFIIWIDTKDGNVENLEQLLPRLSILLKTLITEFLTSNGFLVSSKAKQRTHDTSTRPTLEQSLPTVNQYNHSHGVGNLSRMRSSSELALDDLLSGLPFRGAEQSGNLVSTESWTSQEKGRLTASEFPHRVQDRPSSTNGHHLQWIDPRTGHTVHLDSRTGIALPESRPSLAHNQTSALCQKRKNPVPFARVAQNVRKHLHRPSNNNEKPVRSIGLFRGAPLGPDDVSHVNDRLAKRFGQSSELRNLHDHNLGTPKISRAAFTSMTVLGQVDKKFILGIAPFVRSTFQKPATEYQLVLIDQHAADERVKVEQLICSFYNEIITFDTPIVFESSPREARLLENHKQYFERLLIFYEVLTPYGASRSQDISLASMMQVRITALPGVIAERCRLQTKLIIDVLREEIWSDNTRAILPRSGRAKVPERCGTGNCSYTHPHDISIASTLPPRLLYLLNSRACRSAIMFNDGLTRAQCSDLVKSLAECALPFQCAHGRPSVVTLIDLSTLGTQDPLATNEVGLHCLGLPALGTSCVDWQTGGLNMIDGEKSFGSTYLDWTLKKDSSIESTAE